MVDDHVHLMLWHHMKMLNTTRWKSFVWCYCIDGKFGGEFNLAVWRSIFTTAKLKSANITCLNIIICMVIPYWTAKLKSTNIFTMVIWGPTAKFNSCQYFRLYGMLIFVYSGTSELRTPRDRDKLSVIGRCPLYRVHPVMWQSFSSYHMPCVQKL